MKVNWGEFSFYYKKCIKYLQFKSGMFCSTNVNYLALFLIVKKL